MFQCKVVDENFGRVATASDLIASAPTLSTEFDKVSAELPALLLAANNETGDRQQVTELIRRLEDLKSDVQSEQREAADAERDRCQQELDQKQEQASDVRYQMHKVMNDKTELRDTLTREHADQWDKLTEQLKEQTDHWEREYYEMAGQKTLKKKVLREEKKVFQQQLADQVDQYKKLIEQEDAAIADLKYVVRKTGGKTVPRDSPESEWTDYKSESRDWERDQQRSRSRPRHVSFSDRPEYFARNPVSGDRGEGDGRRRLADFVVDLDDDDDDF